MTRKEHSSRTRTKAGDAPATSRALLKIDAAVQLPWVTESQRREAVRVAAYYLAERRGFEPGHELEDWINAEAQLDATFGTEQRDTEVQH